MKNVKGTLILLITALIWGMAFSAQSSASDSIGSFTFNACRSLLASGVLGLLVLGFRKILHRTYTEVWPTLLRGAVLGVILFTAANLQQFGIALYPDGVAAAGRSGFITATYVVMVTVWCSLRGRKPHPIVWLSVVLCIVGLYLLCCSEGFDHIYFGDILTLSCAVTFTFDILFVNRYAHYDGLLLSLGQFLVCFTLSAIGALIWEKPSLPDLGNAAVPILYAGIFSSGIAYTLQIIGQRYAEPAVASIVMSLESVFAALGGWLLLNERLGGVELFGCILVFAAVILAQMPEILRARKERHDRTGA